MFHLVLVMVPQLIEPQAVRLWIHQRQQFCPKNGILSSVQQALKYRVLYPLPIVDTDLGHLAQALAAGGSFRVPTA